jgi:hypothetical protein
MWRTLRAFGGVPARQFRLQTGLGFHSLLSPGPGYGFAGWPAGACRGDTPPQADLDVVEWYGRIAAPAETISLYA